MSKFKIKPIGISAHRLALERENPREVAMVEQWQHKHEHYDFLSSLLDYPSSDNVKATDQERIVAETVIQWIGSPVGILFLNQALNRVGLEIREIKSKCGECPNE